MKQLSLLWLFPVFLLLLAGLLFLPGFFSKEGVVTLDRPLKSPVFDELRKPNLLLFFGYVGCSDVCMPRLREITEVYDAFSQGQKAAVDVVFVNIKPLDDPEQALLFSRFFHKDFKGIQLEQKVLQRMMGEFDARYAPSLTEAGEFDHTAFLYLVRKEQGSYRLKAIFTQVPFDKEVIGRYLFAEKGEK